MGQDSMAEDYSNYIKDPSERTISTGIDCRIISHETGLYLRGIVGLDGWTDFAVALKSYAEMAEINRLQSSRS
jgi:hypothetical protein